MCLCPFVLPDKRVVINIYNIITPAQPPPQGGGAYVETVFFIIPYGRSLSIALKGEGIRRKDSICLL